MTPHEAAELCANCRKRKYMHIGDALQCLYLPTTYRLLSCDICAKAIYVDNTIQVRRLRGLRAIELCTPCWRRTRAAQQRADLRASRKSK